MPLTRKSQVVFISQLYCIFARRRSLFFLKSLNEAHEGRYERLLVTLLLIVNIFPVSALAQTTADARIKRVEQGLLPVVYFMARIAFFLFLYIWNRGTLPRFRYDQLMAFSWKFLLPLSLANIVVTSLVVALTS